MSTVGALVLAMPQAASQSGLRPLAGHKRIKHFDRRPYDLRIH
jgi:hypothetical protein